MQKYIDAHCHIANGATDNSVVAFFCNSVDENDWAKVLSITQNNSAVIPCIGIHPWYVNGIQANWNVRLRDTLVKNPRAMVGEIGLDKMRPDYEMQLDVFYRCLKIASDLKRGVHIHCVRAWDDMLRILSDVRPSLPAIIFHGFTASREAMNQLTRLGNVYFSFGRAVCDVRRTRLRKTVWDVPMSRVLIESDGAMSDSGVILRRIAQQIADIKNKPIESIINTIYNNTQRVIQNGQTAQNTNVIG